MMRFFRVRSREEVLREIQLFEAVPEEEIPLENGPHRVLSRPIIAPEDFPLFPRATMDGFAVRARDTFGASDSQPALLQVIGEIRMGEAPSGSIGPGQAMRIPTGGMLPEGADAVIMVEHAEEFEDMTLEAYRSVAPGENVVAPGEDVRRGEEILPGGWSLRPQDLGLLAALGVREIEVHRRPRVAVLSTGDEVVGLDQSPAPGQVRDINSLTISAWLEREGAIPVKMGIVRDVPDLLRERIQWALEEADCLIMSGGSSVGTRDHIMDALCSLPGVELLAHGISVRPGKPTLLARSDRKAILGLPGHPVSALVILHLLGRPLLDRLSGKIYAHRPRPFRARLTRNLASAQGREDFVRVALEERDGELWAKPILGASGLIGTLVRAEGIVRIDQGCEGLYQGEWVEVEMFP